MIMFVTSVPPAILFLPKLFLGQNERALSCGIFFLPEKIFS